METIGFIGVGKIGLPVSLNLIKSGYHVVGYRRSQMPEEFLAAGGVAAKSLAEIGAAADIILSCVPTEDALEEVVNGPNGLLQSGRPGQIVVELGSHPVSFKKRFVAPLAEKGVAFLDGEVAGTPGMVVARKGVIFMAGDAKACEKADPVIKGFADTSYYFGPFGAASRAKLINNLLVGIHITATAEAMALALKADIDIDTLIKAVTQGSGGSLQFGIRAPWMQQRRFLPVQGDPVQLTHYFEMIDVMSAELGVATPLLDRAAELIHHGIDHGGIADKDIAAMVDVIGAYPRKGK
jgi:3-hydroxyisobutyrate dehydrogenase-like beta-hydroxyacid dehydrogenase